MYIYTLISAFSMMVATFYSNVLIIIYINIYKRKIFVKLEMKNNLIQRKVVNTVMHVNATAII